jgi:hypothetical protein
MRAVAMIFVLAAGCASDGRETGSPDAARTHERDAPDATPDAAAPQLEPPRDGLTMFFRLDESGDGTRFDRVSGVQLVPWQRTGFARYEVSARGTIATPAVVGDGQHIAGAQGYHFSTGSAPAMKHAGGSFSWAGWVSVDAAHGGEPYTDDQTLVAKWNGVPDTYAANDHREYRVFHEHASSRWRFEVSRDGLEGEGHSRAVTHPAEVERDRLYFVEAWHDAELATINLRVSTRSERGEVASEAWRERVFEGDADLNVGAQNTCTDDHLQGIIDALGHWTRSLSDDESARLWNDGAGLEL